MDEDDDWIQTDRRIILWSDELCRAFKEWGQRVVVLVGGQFKDLMRKSTMDSFLQGSRVLEVVKQAFPASHQSSIRANAINIARTLGKTLGPQGISDEAVVSSLVELSVSVAPHLILGRMIHEAAGSMDTLLSALISILKTAKIAELPSLGIIVQNRLGAINRLDCLKGLEEIKEGDLQRLIEDAP